MLLLGITVGMCLTRVVKALLYGVDAFDPWTIVATVGLLLLVALGAAWIPALPAAVLHPMVALRTE